MNKAILVHALLALISERVEKLIGRFKTALVRDKAKVTSTEQSAAK